MFENAIIEANCYTRPILSILRFFNSNRVIPGAATMFFINNQGWAFTCKHVAEQIIAAEQLGKKYQDYKYEISHKPDKIAPKQWRRDLEKKYQYNDKAVLEIKNRFVGCVDNISINITVHPNYDLALLKFNDYKQLHVSKFPRFPKDTTKLIQGKNLCRIGYPFPEFTNFEYREESDTIEWNNVGNENTPVFPLDGMVTRQLLGLQGDIMGFELSTPGLRGQSGGPVFDQDGLIWGIQFATNHLDLNFDIQQTVIRDGKDKQISSHSFLNVGLAIHINIMKKMMRENGVDFIEE